MTTKSPVVLICRIKGNAPDRLVIDHEKIHHGNRPHVDVDHLRLICRFASDGHFFHDPNLLRGIEDNSSQDEVSVSTFDLARLAFEHLGKTLEVPDICEDRPIRCLPLCPVQKFSRLFFGSSDQTDRSRNVQVPQRFRVEPHWCAGDLLRQYKTDFPFHFFHGLEVPSIYVVP